MKMVVEWEGGGWETNDLTQAMTDDELDSEITELLGQLDAAGDAAKTAKVRFSGGRRCTREVLELMQDQYSAYWRPPSQLRFLNQLLKDPNDHYQHHLYSLFLLENHPGEFKQGAKKFEQGYNRDYALVAAYGRDYETVHMDLCKGITTNVDDLHNVGASETGLLDFPTLWNALDFEKLRNTFTPRTKRVWEGRHQFCERVITLDDMGVKLK